MSTILVVEDEEILRQELAEMLGEKGHRILSAGNGVSALKLFNENSVQLVLSDLNLPQMDGLALLRACRVIAPEVPFVMMTAFGSVKNAVDAMREGAVDYLIKPLALNELLAKTGRLIEAADLRSENRNLRRELSLKLGSYEMVGASAAIAKIRELILKVAPARSPVLITGESGTGKELIARAIHASGVSKNEPFVPVNCAAIPEMLLESELFGHQKGAFTGAIADNEGLFRAARRGTLFLDEIGDMPLSLQAKLLRVLEDKMVHPVGSKKFIPFEGRILAATNRDLRADIQEKKFREDLFFRLSVIELHAPALRQRTEDIPVLAHFFLQRFNRDLNRTYDGFDGHALQLLTRFPWKGNIRELQNAIERAMILGAEPLLRAADFAPSGAPEFSPALQTRNLRDAIAVFEYNHVQRVLAESKQDKRKAAAELGISVSSLYRLLGGKSAEPAPRQEKRQE